jgi:hypothetical protein
MDKMRRMITTFWHIGMRIPLFLKNWDEEVLTYVTVCMVHDARMTAQSRWAAYFYQVMLTPRRGPGQLNTRGVRCVFIREQPLPKF